MYPELITRPDIKVTRLTICSRCCGICLLPLCQPFAPFSVAPTLSFPPVIAFSPQFACILSVPPLLFPLSRCPLHQVFLPPIGGSTVYIFGDPEKIPDESVPLTARVHDECNGEFLCDRFSKHPLNDQPKPCHTQTHTYLRPSAPPSLPLCRCFPQDPMCLGPTFALAGRT